MSALPIRTVPLPQHEGQLSPAEARAWERAQLVEKNFATDQEIAAKALHSVTTMVTEWSDRVQGLQRRWRATWKLLAGNTMDKGGPEDLHVPEIFKAMETLVPRIEEQILEHPVWFKLIPTKEKDRRLANANAAMYDWQFRQANVRSLVQPAIRDMLVTQNAVFYCWWDNRKRWRNVRVIQNELNAKTGRMERAVKINRVETVDYSGPRVHLVDPLDFVIDTKATDLQEATYVGHRFWLTIDEIKRMGEQMGWQNLDKLDALAEMGTVETIGPPRNQYGYTRDPTARWNLQAGASVRRTGHPERIEVVVLYSKLNIFSESEVTRGDYEDVRCVIAGGKVPLEVRVNPLNGGLRPYAAMCVSRSGHEWYSTGPFDNAVRINQHLDRYHQIFLRGAHVAANPMVFAEEDSDMPDSLYKVRPFEVFKGVGPVRFTTVPDGFLRAAPLVIGLLQRNIEETVGSFRLNMGQDSQGTATEATISLQEGNRRTRGLVRACGEGLEHLLELFHKLTMQFSLDDVEFAVLGKRALDLRKTTLSLSPAEMLDDVRFDMVGLYTMRNYGLKATGLQAALNAATPFIVANPTVVDQPVIVHTLFRELVGPEEADRIVKVPTPIDELHSQQEENRGLIAGEPMEVDESDNHFEHLRDLYPLYKRAMDVNDDMAENTRRAVLDHWWKHKARAVRQRAQEGVQQKRAEQQRQLMAPEAGGSQETGQRQSPQAGGMSDAMSQMAMEPGGQTPGENPGPATGAGQSKYGRSGRAGRTTNQTENRL